MQRPTTIKQPSMRTEPGGAQITPFITPLFEVSTELSFAYEPVVDFPGKAVYEHFASRLPVIRQFPLLLVPPENATPEQLRATPAIYRFSSKDDKWSLFLGPRMVAANVRVGTTNELKWGGYNDYRGYVEEVLSVFFKCRPDALVERHSVGFYNRIPVSSIDEVRDTLSASLDILEGADLLEVAAQSARPTKVGSMLSQIFTNPGDEYTNGPFLVINNIIRATVPKEQSGLADVMNWLDASHEIARDAIWSQLSDSVKERWNATSAKNS